MIDEELNAERFENGKYFAEIPFNLPCLFEHERKGKNA
jgi:hypothetical protein